MEAMVNAHIKNIINEIADSAERRSKMEGINYLSASQVLKEFADSIRNTAERVSGKFVQEISNDKV